MGLKGEEEGNELGRWWEGLPLGRGSDAWDSPAGGGGRKSREGPALGRRAGLRPCLTRRGGHKWGFYSKYCGKQSKGFVSEVTRHDSSLRRCGLGRVALSVPSGSRAVSHIGTLSELLRRTVLNLDLQGLKATDDSKYFFINISNL